MLYKPSQVSTAALHSPVVPFSREVSCTDNGLRACSQARLHSALSFCASLAQVWTPSRLASGQAFAYWHSGFRLQAKSDHKVGPAYNSVGATPQLWHMDKKGQRAPRPSRCASFAVIAKLLSGAGYEKLKPYGFLVHGCIDGGSNFVVYATVALDKSRPTLLKEFEAVTAKFGLPQRLRSDMALEAAFAGQHMWEEHGPESYMVGRSTVNQVALCHYRTSAL